MTPAGSKILQANIKLIPAGSMIGQVSNKVATAASTATSATANLYKSAPANSRATVVNNKVTAANTRSTPANNSTASPTDNSGPLTNSTLLTADQVNITSSGWITLANSTTTTTTTTTTMSTTANLHSAPAPNISTPANRSMCTPASYQLTVCCHLMTHFEEDIFFKEGVLLNSILQERSRLFETPRSDQIIKTISYFKLWYFLTK